MRKTLNYKGKDPARSKKARALRAARTKKSPNAMFGLNPPLEEGGGDMLRCRNTTTNAGNYTNRACATQEYLHCEMPNHNAKRRLRLHQRAHPFKINKLSRIPRLSRPPTAGKAPVTRWKSPMPTALCVATCKPGDGTSFGPVALGRTSKAAATMPSEYQG